ncbi:MAG: hypothetical protein ABI624_17655 [Casimicrobiaceae bacterium]
MHLRSATGPVLELNRWPSWLGDKNPVDADVLSADTLVQNIGRGQMVGADFTVTPSVVFSENNAGGMGGAVGGLLGRFGNAGAVVGAVAGGLKFKEAQTSMLVVDVRSSIQVAAAQGSAQQTDFALGGALLGGGGGAALGARRGAERLPQSHRSHW